MSNKINADDFSVIKENKKDFKQSVIGRSNLTNEFTIQSLEDHQTELTKAKAAIESQLKLTRAAIGNIERNHETVAKLSQEDLATAAYLYENQAVETNAANKLKEINTALKKYDDTLDVIYTKFGFVKSEKGIKFKVVYEDEESNKA